MKKLHLLSILVFLCLGAARANQTANALIELQTEYLVNPLGIDTEKPRLMWKLNGLRQTAYQIFVGADSAKVAKAIGPSWTSTKLSSAQNLVIYAGEKLKPFTKYYWTVRLWGPNQKLIAPAKLATFETGMMSMANWTGDWISDSFDMNFKPAPYFRKKIALTKRIKSARIYLAAAGLYELSVNGQRIGNHRLDPMYTRFDRRNLYLTHDVTPYLKNGENAMGVLLGNGWYNHQSTAVWNFDKANWRARPAFCLDLRITYTDGSTEIIGSGKDWKTAPSPVIFNSIYTAEHYNAQAEQPNWNRANFIDTAWKNASLRAAPSQQIVAQVMHPVRDIDTLKAVSFKKLSNTEYLFDIGQNISGVSEITVKGNTGTVIRLVHAELLGKNGDVNLGNIDYHYRPTNDQDPFQTDIVTLGGKGTETFRARFNYKGFQYVKVTSSKPVELTQQSLIAYFMHSDVPAVGQLSSSNETLNKIWKATNNSYLSNLFGYPTDCPQREKNGWTGDAHIAIETGLYNFDGITIYEKWLADHRDEQQPNGVLPAIIPTSGWGYSWANGPDWTSSVAIVPWQVYLFYGDSKVLADNYQNIKSYAEHIRSISKGNLTDWGLGDWVPVKTNSTVELTSSIYYHTVVNILAKSAKLLGKERDAQTYARLASDIRNAINSKYLNSKTGIYANGTQTELSAPLFWGIVPEADRKRVATNLAQKVNADGNQIDVGLLGSKTILNALSENGYGDLAYQLASRETYPSWGWWIKNGATTLRENWDVTAVQDNSHNHIMFGEIGAWYYKTLAGLKPNEQRPGFKHVELCPQFVPGLSHFTASYNGRYGTIESAWKRVGDAVAYHATIPANSTATLSFRAGQNVQFFESEAHQNKLTMKPSVSTDGKINFQLAAGNYYVIIR